MSTYRREIKHGPASEYAWVELGPIPGLPGWHIQSKPTSYPFPTNSAALQFAASHRMEGRRIEVYMKEGE